MTRNPAEKTGPICTTFPSDTASAADWIDWFWTDFFTGWIKRTRDDNGIGFFDFLHEDGSPGTPNRKTILAQGRLLFTLSHMALISGNPMHFEAAKAARDAVRSFRKAPGLYCRGVNGTGGPTGEATDLLATSYDQSFVILGLSTWGKLYLEEDVTDELEEVWAAVETTLHDPVTGMMLEHDNLPDPTAPDAPPRAQNPHMHLFEAAMQAYEMTGRDIWLTRAQSMRAKGLEYFFDTDSGTIGEFIAPDLTQLPGRDGQWREIGHQCEWAWLLLREVDLGGDPAMKDVAARMLDFADKHGFQQTGPMKGAAFDAVSCDTSWREEKFLLWPQTEVIKTYAVRGDKAKADELALVIFRQYFAGRAAYVNQLDVDGNVLWNEGLSRLHYHLVLALTEGARAGFWANPS